jgi:glycine/D-amino acid oxidase-like deaminating enzyme
MSRHGVPTSFERAERRVPGPLVDSGLAGAAPTPYWLDRADRPDAGPALRGGSTTDLAIVGGGYTGLWTALLAKERDPSRRVVLLEGGRVGWAASGRNGGFCEYSLTHGESNGERHLPREAERLAVLGRKNLAEIGNAVRRHGIDCDYSPAGTLTVATEPHQAAWLAEEAAGDPDAEFLDVEAIRAEVASPLFHAALRDRTSTVLLHPAKLAWGLARACRDLGVEIHESTPVRSLESAGSGVVLRTDGGSVHAAFVALATNAFPSLLRRHRLFTVPVYDYALMTRPLDDAQQAAIGWGGGEGIADLNNRFHYLRPTVDAEGRRRILIGGYDAAYHYGRSLKRSHEQNPASFRRLAAHFYAMFPQLEDVGFSHRWGGAIDTCSRFFPFFDTSHAGRVAYCAGFTGLGVGASRFGANVMLDLLAGDPTELTELEMVRRKPIPFPPEPAAWLGIKATTAALVGADRNEGRRGPLLKVLDAVGMGFDS